MVWDLQGANVIVGQSGGQTSVINSSLAGVYETAMQRKAGKVYGMRFGIQGLLEDNIIDMGEYINSDLEIELLKRTPSSFLGSCRFKLPEAERGNEIFEKIFEILNRYEIKYFFYIGGNDSMDTIKKLYDYGEMIGTDIKFMGVPKTIDNDLAMTDHTPGFGSAAKYVNTMVKEVILDAAVYDAPSVTVIEVMGRNAGWLTGSTALAKGPDCSGVDLIYMPEYPFSLEDCLRKVTEIQKKKKFVVIAVSEGLCDENGESISAQAGNATVVDAFGHATLSGVGQFIANYLGDYLKCKVRSVELSSVQRCGSHMVSRVDITEAYTVGGAAVKAAMNGESGRVVILKRVSQEPYTCITDTFDVHKVANVEKKVPYEWINETHDGVTEDFLKYARPLIQAELTPVMVDGLPMHITLTTALDDTPGKKRWN